jgi:ligand-binding SRPBCC domain-containing protein
MVNERSKMLVWAYHQRVSRLKNLAEKLKIRYGKNKTISVRVKGRLDPISPHLWKKRKGRPKDVDDPPIS